MTIDEAIAHARAIAKYKRKNLINVLRKIFTLANFVMKYEVAKKLPKNKNSLQCGWKNWKLLKNRLNIKLNEALEKGKKIGYNKAIDDFVRFANTMPAVEQEDGEIRPMWLEEMAERLKKRSENNERRDLNF